MSRVKEFDENVVLDRALELFRRRGFKHTSFGDLTTELEISRQSLYDTYGDKQQLYQTALKRYVERTLDQMRRILETEGPVRSLFAELFDAVVGDQCMRGSPGCMMVNSMVELAPHDADTRALAQYHAREIEGLFSSRLALAQRRGDLAIDKDPVGLARLLYNTMLGLAVSARALGDTKSLRTTAHLALQCLD